MTRRALLGLLLAACATVQQYGSAPFQVRCNVPDAMVLVDDVPLGRVSEWTDGARGIRPGFHRVEVRHPGHHSYYTEVQARDGVPIVVKAELRPLLE